MDLMDPEITIAKYPCTDVSTSCCEPWKT